MSTTEQTALELAKAVLAFDRAVRMGVELQRDDITYQHMVALANKLLIAARGNT